MKTNATIKKKKAALFLAFQEVWQYSTHFGKEQLASLIRLEHETYPPQWNVLIGMSAESWTPASKSLETSCLNWAKTWRLWLEGDLRKLGTCYQNSFLLAQQHNASPPAAKAAHLPTTQPALEQLSITLGQLCQGQWDVDILLLLRRWRK